MTLGTDYSVEKVSGEKWVDEKTSGNTLGGLALAHTKTCSLHQCETSCNILEQLADL